MPEEFEALDQVANTPTEAVERGDDQDIYAARLHRGEEPIEAGPAIFGPRLALVELFGRCFRKM